MFINITVIHDIAFDIIYEAEYFFNKSKVFPITEKYYSSINEYKLLILFQKFIFMTSTFIYCCFQNS